MALNLKNTGWEFCNQRGPWLRSTLRAVGLAVVAVGTAPNEEAAHELVWDAVMKAGEHAPMSRALEAANVNVDAVRSAMRPILDEWARDRDQVELNVADGTPLAFSPMPSSHA